MADLSFHHGARVFESDETPVLIRTDQSAVVFLIGTAPDADEDAFPFDKPVLLYGKDSRASKLGNAGTLKAAYDGILDQHGPYVYISRVEVGDTDAETLSNLVGDSTALTGVHAAKKCESLYGLKPRIFIAPGFTASTPTDGIASIQMTNQGSGYHSAPSVAVSGGNDGEFEAIFADGKVTGVKIKRAGAGFTTPAVSFSGGGSGAAATALVNSGAVSAISVTNGGAGYVTPPAVTITGAGSGAAATAVLTDGVVTAVTITNGGTGYSSAPTIAFSGGSGAAATAHVGNVMNPVVAEMMGVLDDIRAIAFVDGPDTTDAEAYAYRSLINSQRIYVIDPKALVWDTTADAYVPQPASPRFAGRQCQVDRDLGFWWSVSNKPINGIGGTTRPVTYGAQANYLNERAVNTIINLQGEGFRTWGNRVTTGDDLWRFLSVRRTADFINEAIEKSYTEFVDKPFSLANLKFMIESGRAFMRTLVAEGAILGGDVWLDPERNTNEEMASGRVTLGVKFEPPAPMEDIRVIAHREIQYYAQLRDRVLSELGDGALSAA
ncbi:MULTISPECIES: phage tail sheath C-terminal domain-containing protein [unclassified Chelatococcus]|uniref:phage tail sheath C-terminal domain-containing protein n=1 Tax=unclassified Chelatococcus TaxID=2638111 RepID=UPI001BD05227|nr:MULTISPECIES: phage tail sheath C-terminal domain-containing protein [unclassified Chelatococcus]MBS7737792.1 phage tail sheath subtilisin-like domain-containing protein [Chelatococcus sp. HY11]MCO5079248.1 phage tail sheath subtilisin-like domain-containing protein [Chelatococcus sp.]CAH1665910.1 Phage tail protein [Hyphomicrobiales bacterium]CAH1681024.1 Phage tail protein [Hyphomicrobiales bacterium]